MATLPSTEIIATDADAAAPEPLRVIRLGTVPYREAWQLQLQTADAVRRGAAPETLLLLEHPHTYTRGRLSPDAHLLLSPQDAAQRGAEIVETDRGGLVTYHGPGQLVAYPIIRLRGRGGPHWYVRTLEQVIIRSLSDFGLPCNTAPGLTGVWTSDGQRKIAAIGVKIAAGTTHHGCAINVCPDLQMFDAIIPCGITDRGVTSLATELSILPSLDRVAEVVARRFCEGFGFEPVWAGSPVKS